MTEAEQLIDKLETLDRLYKALDNAVKQMEDALQANASTIPPAAQAALLNELIAKFCTLYEGT